MSDPKKEKEEEKIIVWVDDDKNDSDGWFDKESYDGR